MLSSSGKVTSPNNAASDCGVAVQEIPEWKKILIMKKRTGAGVDEEIKNSQTRCPFRGPVLSPTEEQADRVVDTVSRRDNSPSGPTNKFHHHMSRPSKCVDAHTWSNATTETAPDKVVKTIGNIKVELRSVHKYSAPADCGLEEEFPSDRLVSPLSEPVGALGSVGDWDDNEEDLQYGPGIVDKLRARFLNLEAKNRRKPVVRKFSSLENLTAGGGSAFRANGGFQPRIGEKRFGMRTARSYNNFNQRGGTNFKKAQSMETLLVGTADSSTATGRRILNARIFSRTSNSAQVKEKSPSPVSKFSDVASFRLGNKTEYVRQPSINEDELPRPDTVKHFKRIFESPPLAQVEDKMCHSAGVVNHTAHENKNETTTCDQSFVLPASVLGTPANSGAAPKAANCAIFGSTHSRETYSTKSCSESKSSATKSAKEEEEETKESPSQYIPNGLPFIENEYRKKLPDVQRNSVLESPDSNGDIISPEINREELFISGTGERLIGSAERDDPFVRAKEENVLRREESFLELESPKVTCDRLPRCESPSDNVDDHLRVPSEAERKEDVGEEVEEELSVTERELHPEEQASDTTLNGEDMVVAASQAGDEHLRGPDVARTELRPARKPSNWQKPPPPTTSIVFDFRGKDVKPNISLSPAPFGCRPAKVKKRAGSPPRGDGPKVNGSDSCVKDDSDEDQEDWDEMDIGADLPAISGIVFAGENVKVGRGSLLERRNKNLTIQFDDAATSTYEYPCESPGDENGQSPVDNQTVSSNHMKSSLAISSNTGLSNYTPHVLNSGEEFKLGVSRPPVLRYASPKPKKCESPVAAVDELVPATPEDSTGWSSADSADILF